ncbi:uncharacterized protein P174DRAFT_429542 [Aspergillus novofumigatus IBT 16806]|uniref:Uncharacterized protein n=1 Tax=Aspergillus novofumigatus (strain IBT 16806) TaxID=1392255 RepID=A0A2I1CBZ3_ASPN1|nr:uncharacterized protein P174DRAFT_429542 [Aspergillus novofumigatus IBT 16806]PKX95124.1 hypothetical protein P174DRAFT_429542 [Aspergillus novofumigatus IBT 16806]
MRSKTIPVLKNIPKGPDSLSKEVLNKDFEQEVVRGDVIRILGFVTASLRPLSVLEISEACHLHLDEDVVRTGGQFTREEIASYRLMVIIQEKVLILHQSVSDYLESAGYLDELKAHTELAYCCVDPLIEESHYSELSAIHFSLGVAQNGPNHARVAESKFAVQDSQVEFFGIHPPCREQYPCKAG